MPRFDLEMSRTMRSAGWVESTPIPDGGRRFRHPAGKEVRLSYIDATLTQWPWCHQAMLNAFNKGAVGWTITELKDEGGTLTLKFIPEWPDAVTALGLISADKVTA